VTTDDAPLRANDLASKRDTFRLFVGRASAQVLVAAAVTLAALRVAIGGDAGRGDVIALVITIAITGSVEWIIHRHLLHAPEDAWASRRLGTGTGHRGHHLDPPDIDWLLLRGLDAAVFVTAFGFVTAAWSVPVMWATGSTVGGGFLTAWLLAALGLLHYEWVHLLVHTRYRPRTRYYRTLARRHRLHHHRNERYWLGVTSNTGDRLMRTLPRETADVPLSDTARTLAER
jgi:hypothetical protein